MSSSGMIPPPNTTMSHASRSASSVDELAEQRHVGAGEHREADQVGVLLDGGLDDLLGRLVEPGVDDLVAGVAQRPRDDLGAAVVPVEPGLADDDPDRPGRRRRSWRRVSELACSWPPASRRDPATPRTVPAWSTAAVTSYHRAGDAISASVVDPLQSFLVGLSTPDPGSTHTYGSPSSGSSRPRRRRSSASATPAGAPRSGPSLAPAVARPASTPAREGRCSAAFRRSPSSSASPRCPSRPAARVTAGDRSRLSRRPPTTGWSPPTPSAAPAASPAATCSTAAATRLPRLPPRRSRRRRAMPTWSPRPRR